MYIIVLSVGINWFWVTGRTAIIFKKKQKSCSQMLWMVIYNIILTIWWHLLPRTIHKLLGKATNTHLQTHFHIEILRSMDRINSNSSLNKTDPFISQGNSTHFLTKFAEVSRTKKMMTSWILKSQMSVKCRVHEMINLFLDLFFSVSGAIC